jgi:hypothetical protein
MSLALMGAVAVSCRLGLGATYHVWADSPVDGPGASWETAFHDIQSAVDAATEAGDVVLVTNGLYTTGARVTPGYASLNRVVITVDIVIRSVNGPEVTAICGQGPVGEDAVRCVFMTAGTLVGFTLTNGCTLANGDREYDRSGCGLNAYRGHGVSVSNCLLSGNGAFSYGGGAYRVTLAASTLDNNLASGYGGGSCWSTLINCAISDNTADMGGGASEATLANCTLSGNAACYGGAAWSCTLNNCIAYYNRAPTGPNLLTCTSQYTCSAPAPDGEGNIEGEPQFVDAESGDFRLRVTSPCIDSGLNAAMPGGPDAAGVPRPLDGDANGSAVVDLGCHEFASASADTDRDGLGDTDELSADTDPTRMESCLAIVGLHLEDGQVSVDWKGGTRVTQYLECTTNLAATAVEWVAVYTNLPPTPSPSRFTHDRPDHTTWFYRVRTGP